MSRAFKYFTPKMIAEEKGVSIKNVQRACRRAGFRRPRQPGEIWVLSPAQAEKVRGMIRGRAGNPRGWSQANVQKKRAAAAASASTTAAAADSTPGPQ